MSAVPSVEEIAGWVCEARNLWAEQWESKWLEDDEPHPDDFIGQFIRNRLLEGVL